MSMTTASKYPRNRLTTPEQDEWIKANAYGKSGRELQQMIKENFGLDFTLAQIKSYKGRHHINTGLTGYFKKGQIPFNKGKKMPPEQYEKCKGTMFKKGRRPKNWRPVGSERINAYGYIEVKVKEPNKWMLKSRVVWEAHNGPMPKKHCIIYADGDKLNCDISNLRMIHRGTHWYMNSRDLRGESAEITDLGIELAHIVQKARQRRIGNGNKSNGESSGTP